MNKLKVLFICKDNACRSQMAAAFLNACFGDRYEAYSAGVKPSPINPCAKKAMKEIGIDISSCRPKDIKEFHGKKFDCIVTLCDHAKAHHSTFPECKKHLHKGFKDPADFKGTPQELLSAFRCLREEICEWVEKEAVF